MNAQNRDNKCLQPALGTSTPLTLDGILEDGHLNGLSRPTLIRRITQRADLP